jgi:hypothetical protein
MSTETDPLTDRIAVGAVIRRVFVIYAERASLLIPVAAVVFLIAGVLDTMLRKGSGGLSLLSLPVSVVSNALVVGIVVALVADIQDGRGNAGSKKLLASIKPVLGQLILVRFVAALAVGIGFVLLVVPGLILLTIWAVFQPVIVLERPPGFQALGRSRDLVRGNGWRVFRVVLILVVVVDVLVGGITFADRSSPTLVHLVVLVVLDTLTIPLSALASAVLYFDLCAAARSRAPR